MTDGRQSGGSTSLRAVLGHALRAALGISALCALVDLWQVALLDPASIAATGVPVLVGVYVLGSLLLAGVPLLAVWLVRRDALPRAVPVLRAVVLAAWAFFLAQGVVLRVLPSASMWRTPSVLALAVAAVALVWPVRMLAARRVPRWGLAVAWVFVLLGGVGAVRGFATAGRRPGPGPAGGSVDTADARPNVILIAIDTLRADHLSCYGYPRPTTPVLDTLAGEGVLFAKAYSQSSWTKPATTSLLTSQYPSMHQTNLERSRIPDAEVLLPEVLHDAGYTTAVLSGNPWVTTEYGFNQGVDHFYSIYEERFARATLFMPALKRANNLTGAPLYNVIKRMVQGELSTTARDEQLQMEAARWLGANRGRRFFIYMHLMSPHHPYDPPPPYDSMFVQHPQRPPITNYPRKSYFFGEEGQPLSIAELKDLVGHYDGDIRFGDTVVGKLLGTLRRLDLLERTVVIVTADHGEEFYDHKNWGHGHSVYNELLHVPLLIRYPARFPRGLRVDSTVMTIDVMPTILELVEARNPAPMAGQSLLDIVDGKPSSHPAEAFSELLYRYGTGRALVEGDRKLIEITVGDEQRREMYDLRADPDEQRSIVLPELPRLLSRIAEVAGWAEQHRVDAAEAHVTDEMEKRVKALGYVN